MAKSIEIKYIDSGKPGMELSYSQPKANYSRGELMKRLEEYEKEMIR